TPSVRLRLEVARYVLAEDYVRAIEARDWFRREVDLALRGNDALVLPTLPIPAPILGARTVRIGANDEPVRNVMLRLTQLFNLTGHPAIPPPGGKTPAGLPYGLQLVGTRMQTENLLSVAKTIETILANLSM